MQVANDPSDASDSPENAVQFPIHIKELCFTASGLERTDPSFVQKLHHPEVPPEKSDGRVRNEPMEWHMGLLHQHGRTAMWLEVLTIRTDQLFPHAGRAYMHMCMCPRACHAAATAHHLQHGAYGPCHGPAPSDADVPPVPDQVRRLSRSMRWPARILGAALRLGVQVKPGGGGGGIPASMPGGSSRAA